jgi:hypothetical protein
LRFVSFIRPVHECRILISSYPVFWSLSMVIGFDGMTAMLQSADAYVAKHSGAEDRSRGIVYTSRVSEVAVHNGGSDFAATRLDNRAGTYLQYRMGSFEAARILTGYVRRICNVGVCCSRREGQAAVPWRYHPAV